MPDFSWAYEPGHTPPWDIGRPQSAIVRAEDAGEIRGSVLDVGCGTGEHAIFLASRGHDAHGVDYEPAAIERARAKATERRSRATFEVGDALDLKLARTFEAAVDTGCFHVFDDADRPRYVASVKAALKPGATLHLMCFSERETIGGGPRRVTQAEIREAFRDGWRVEEIREAQFEAYLPGGGAHAWIARIRRL